MKPTQFLYHKSLFCTLFFLLAGITVMGQAVLPFSNSALVSTQKMWNDNVLQSRFDDWSNKINRTSVDDACFIEDFADITNGNNTTTGGSGTIWNGNTNFPTVEKAYQADGAVKLGTGSLTGFIESRALTEVTGDITVNIMVKGWTNVEGDLVVSIDGQNQTLSYTAKMADPFEQVTATFTGVAAGSNLKIETTAKRAFIDNVEIFCTPPTPPTITLADNGTQVAAADVQQGTTNHIISTFKQSVTDSNATLNEAYFTTSGNYESTDVTGFKLWYNGSNSFATASQLGSTFISTSTGGGDLLEFTGLSQNINKNVTGYFWVTADISASATVGRTISLDGIAAADFIFAETGTSQSGSASAGGTQTITLDTTPTILIENITNTDFGSVCVGSTSAITGSFDFYGMFLTGNATIGPLAGYTFSIDDTTYTNSLTLIPDGGGDVAESIYIHFTPGSTGSFNGNIPVAGGGAPSTSVAVTGAGITAPVITTQPANQTVSVGSTATFTVAAQYAVSYQWQENTGTGFTDISGATSSSYTTPPTTLAMNGYQYRVIITNDCGDITSNVANLTVNLVSNTTDYFRSRANGNWTSSSTWQSSPDGINWMNSTLTPGANASGVEIRVGEKVTINSSAVFVTNTTVYGTIEVTTDGAYSVDGDDHIELTIEDGGVFLVNSPGDYAVPAGIRFGLVKTGGKLIAASNTTASGTSFANAYLGRESGLFYFGDGAICEWANPYTTLGSSAPLPGNRNFFFPYEEGDIPIFRVTATPVFEFGNPSIDNTFYSIIEIIEPASFPLGKAGEKTFIGGVRGTGKLIMNNSSGPVNIGTATVIPELGGTASIVTNNTNGRLRFPNGANVPAGAYFTIENNADASQSFQRNGGIFNIDGSLDITNQSITNSANGGISVNNGGTIRTRHTGGLVGTGSAIPSNIGNVTLKDGSTVDYYATLDQAISSAPNYYHIIFSGAGTKTPGSNIDVNTNGSVTITGTPTVDFSTKNLGSTSSNTTAFTMDGGRLILGTTGTLPNMMGTYNLSGGVVEFSNTSGTGQTIRTTPTYKYLNIEVTGGSVGTSGGNVALRPDGSFIVKTDGIFTIRDRSIKCYNTIPGDLGTGTGCSVTVENDAIFRTGNNLGFSGYGSDFGGDSSAVDENITNINLQNGSTVDYLGEKTAGQEISLDTGYVPGNLNAHYSNLTISGDLKNELTGTLIVDNVLEIKDHTNGANSYTGKLVVAASGNSDPANVVYANKGVKVTSGDFILKNNAQLMQDEDADNNGHIRMERQFTFSEMILGKQYNFVSAPVTNSGTDIRSSIYYPAIPQSVQRYNEADYYFYETNGPYIPGKGYAVQEVEGTTDEIGQFTGTPNNGNSLSFTLKKSTPAGGFNLTGNPYPSNLDIDELYDDNEGKIEPTFYFWDNRGNEEFEQQGILYNGDHYAKYNAPSGTGASAAVGVGEGYEERIPTKNVKAMTGFMVQAISNDVPLNFNNDQRLTDGGPGFFGKGQNFDQPQKDRYWLTMTTPGEIRVMNAVVYFDDGNDEFWLDDTESFEGSDDLYTINDGHKLTIQGRAPFRVNDVLPLGYKAFGTGTHIISVYQKEGIFAESQDIWLVDMLLNKTVNLSKKPYKFITRAGEYGNRFKIVYRPSFQTGVDISANDISMLKVGQQIEISSTIDRISEVEVFDLNSRPVFKKNEINQNKFIVNAISFNHQILIIKVKTETGETVTRKFVMK